VVLLVFMKAWHLSLRTGVFLQVGLCVPERAGPSPRACSGSWFCHCRLSAALSNMMLWVGEKGGNQIAFVFISLFYNVYEKIKLAFWYLEVTGNKDN